jgi:PEP-CTERM/exosortase A-associated glycosyltransferase
LPILNQFGVVHSLRAALISVLKSWRPDIVHAHSPALNALAALHAPRRLFGGLVYEMRSSWEDAAVDHGTAREGDLRYRLSRSLETYVLRRADGIATICEGLKAEVIARGVDTERVSVVPNAVEPSAFAPRPQRDESLAAELRLGAEPVIGFAGSFYHYEGLDLLVEALALLRQRQRAVTLLLLGGGFEEERLRAQIAALSLEPWVRMVGRVPQQQVPRYYSLCTVLVYPRHRMRLTEMVTPLKPLEAMASGIPVIASDVGGHREQIRNCENGILFPAGRAEALADAITTALDDPLLLTRIVARGKEFVARERTWPAVVRGYAPLYESTLKRAGQ